MANNVGELKDYDRDVMIQQVSNCVSESMKQFENYWKCFGITKDQTVERANSLLNFVCNYINDLVEDEKNLYDSLLEKIANYKAELQVLRDELGFKVSERYANLTLLEEEKSLRSRLDELKAEKRSRIDDYERLAKREQDLCDLLDIAATSVNKLLNVPSKEELYELRENIRMLENEKKCRTETFYAAKQKLTTIMEVTELTAETSFERDVLCYEDDTVKLSKENVEQMKQLVLKFESKRVEIEQEIKSLRDRLAALWDRLNVGEEERAAFLENHGDLRQSTLVALREEIERYEEIKRQNIGTYIVKLKDELTELWHKCYLSGEEQLQFNSYDCAEYSEELLDALDMEVDRLRKFYTENKHIFDKLEKRKILWDMMLQFERKADDPNRFNNRGGNLLKEERERKRILRDLPQLEENILKAIGEYEASSDKVFLVYGMNFVEYTQGQWTEHNTIKEQQKLDRQKSRLVPLNQTKTPSKRQFGSTPMSCPSKLFRTGLSTRKSAKSDKPSASPSPLVMRTRANVHKWVSPRFTTPNKRTPVTKVLLEKNDGNCAANKLNDTTSYSKFMAEVARDDRRAYRSSGTHRSRVVLGSKINHSGSLRKSMSRSSRKSSNYTLRSTSKIGHAVLNSVSKTPTRLTQARGKLGLPFLV